MTALKPPFKPGDLARHKVTRGTCRVKSVFHDPRLGWIVIRELNPRLRHPEPLATAADALEKVDPTKYTAHL
jgi:hypothetical protein